MDKQTDRQSDRWIHKQTYRWSYKQTDERTNKQTDNHTKSININTFYYSLTNQSLPPHNCIVACFVFRSSLQTKQLHASSVGRGRNSDLKSTIRKHPGRHKRVYLNFLCKNRRFEIRFQYDLHLLFRPSDFPHERNDTERQTDVACCAILHQFELAVRWDERNAPFRLEFAKFYTLMECARVDGNTT